MTCFPACTVPGWHNRMNAACAATAALAAGCSRDAIDRGLQSFRGLPQRMELIAQIEGRTFYNDSTSTTPESTIAALESVGKPAFLLAGGHDKGFDFTEMVETIGRLAVGAAFFGEIGPRLHDRLPASHVDCLSIAVPTLDEALRLVLAQFPAAAMRSSSRPVVRATTSSAISASGGSGLTELVRRLTARHRSRNTRNTRRVPDIADGKSRLPSETEAESHTGDAKLH